ncbi:MAG: hypothetical protein IPN75_18540 [Dechloromonas sp.]|uniref:Uncharacterized protein n=1 Tax=Candidatus Dechloromonas phosphorivorans TaxID=2899244 RepID=A0A9D7LQN5_9RHOO|nr:hypothetical protein [Candidatus Dechloromonas phosphorivorans]
MDRAWTYLIRHTTRDSKALLVTIDHRLDKVNAGESRGGKAGDERHRAVTLKLAPLLFVDSHAENLQPPAPSSSSTKQQQHGRRRDDPLIPFPVQPCLCRLRLAVPIALSAAHLRVTIGLEME